MPPKAGPARPAPGSALAGMPGWGDRAPLRMVPPPFATNNGNAAEIMFIVPSTFNRITALPPFAAIPSAGTKY